MHELGKEHDAEVEVPKEDPTAHPSQGQLQPFDKDQAAGVYVPEKHGIYVTQAKTSAGQVEFAKLPEAEKALFRESRKKEMASLLENKAVRVMSVEESRAFRKQFPDYVIGSRFVDRYKPREDDTNILKTLKERAIKMSDFETPQEERGAPKSRWCVIGWMDPHVKEVERSSPTPATTSIYTCLQVAASRQWEVNIRDVKTAFLQGRATTRTRKLACSLPRDEVPEGFHAEQLLMLETEVYGLVSGPAWWRASFLQTLFKLGYKLGSYDKCVLSLGDEQMSTKDNRTQGLVIIEVDDVLECGEKLHRQKMKELESMIRFGKSVNLAEDKAGCMYAGRSLRQLPGGGFGVHMEEYIYKRLSMAKIQRKVLKKFAATAELWEEEKTQMRGIMASLGWLSREGRPDVASAASILAGSFPTPMMDHLFEANEVVKHLKVTPVELKIWPIPEEKLRLVLLSDAAFDTSSKEKSQHGWIIGCSDNTLNQGEEAPFSWIQWRSRRLRRKASSSTLCEALRMSAATAALEKQQALLESMRFADFTPRSYQRSDLEDMELRGQSTVIANDSRKYADPECILIMDSKSLFDALSNETMSGDCERSQLEYAVIKESISLVRGRCRWLPHNKNPADLLTKRAGGHAEPMMNLLKYSRIRIQDEETEMSHGKQGLNRQKTKASKAL